MKYGITNDKMTQSVAEAVKHVLQHAGESQYDLVTEGKMKELHALMKKGMKDPKKIAKELGLAGTKEVHDAISQLIKKEMEVMSKLDQDVIDLHTIDKVDDPEQEKYTEELSPKQKKLDINKNGKIDGEDLANLRKKAKKEEDELEEEDAPDAAGNKKATDDSAANIGKEDDMPKNESTEIEEALSKNDKTAGYAGRGQFELKRHIMPLVDKNKSLKDVYFDGPDLVGDAKSGKQPTIAKGVLTDKKMTVGDLEKVIKNFKESTTYSEEIISKILEKKSSEIKEAPKFGHFNSTFQGSEKVFKDLTKDLKKAGLDVKMIGKPTKHPDIGPMERIIDFYAIGAVADVKKVQKKLESKYELSLSTVPESVQEAIQPGAFIKGGNVKVTQDEVDNIFGRIFLNDRMMKQLEKSKAFKAGESGKGKKKNPYKKDTADFHHFELGAQAAEVGM